MVEISPQQPINIKAAAHEITNEGLMTLAAFLLSAGVWYRRPNEEQPILPADDLEQLGLRGWRLVDAEPRSRFEPNDPIFSEIVDPRSIADPHELHSRLGQLIWTAFNSHKSSDLAKAVMNGTASPDPLVRVCALTSAFEMFNYSFRQRVRELSDLNIYEGETTSAISSMLVSRVFNLAVSAANPPQVASEVEQTNPGLMLIHGTNFPLTLGNGSIARRMG
jgi:hypothetical protein